MSEPIRERRRLGAIDYIRNPDQTEQEQWEAWGHACEAAYAVMRKHVPILKLDHVTPLEPWGSTSGVFEWRTYWHSEDGLETVYVAIRELPPIGHREPG